MANDRLVEPEHIQPEDAEEWAPVGRSGPIGRARVDPCRPVVLYAVLGGVRRVVACCAQAAGLGVRVGMTLAEVAAVSKPAGSPGRASPEPLTALPHDPAADRRALLELAALCGRFSPVVGVEDASAPESLLLDITGVAGLFGGEETLARRVGEELAVRGLEARLCVADTVGAAWAGAHWLTHVGKSTHGDPHDEQTHNQGTHVKHLPGARVCLLPPGKTGEVLRALPIEALRLRAETVELLHRLGLRWIGRLECLARKELGTRFGAELLRRMDQAFGRLSEPVSAAAPPARYRVEWSGEYPLVRQEQIDDVLGRLLERLCAVLRRSGRGAVGLECRLDCLGGGRVPIRLGLFRPAAWATHLAELVRLRLDCLRLPGPVVGMELEAVRTAPLKSVQARLFDLSGSNEPGANTWQGDARELAGLVERLSSRLGSRAVLRVRWLRHCQPELAWEYEPVIDGQLRARRRPARPAPRSAPPLRPLRLLPQPVLLEAAAIHSSLSGGLPAGRFSQPEAVQPGAIQPGAIHFIGEPPPRQFTYAGRRHQVARTWGPERIETGWWRRGAIRRDYYRVETTSGRRYWIFRRLGDGRWFLHGMFE